MFIYTRGPEATAYHIPQDTYESLPLTEFEDLFRLVRDYICNTGLCNTGLRPVVKFH